MEKIYEEIKCCICGNDELIPVSAEVWHDAKAKVCICKKCGLTQLNPRMSAEAYHDYYINEYDKHYRPQPKDNHYKKVKIITKRLRSGGYLKKNITNVLEIGAGSGEALAYLKRKVLPDSNFYAIEPSDNCKKELAKCNISLVSAYLEDINIDKYKNMFDLIIMRHVVEHFTDPISNLKIVSQLLSENGVFYMAVPNSLRPTLPLRNYCFRNVHTYYFNIHTTKNLFALSNLEVLSFIEGDIYLPYELVVFASKSKNPDSILLDASLFARQKKLYTKLLKREKTLLFKVYNFFRHRVQKYSVWLLLKFE